MSTYTPLPILKAKGQLKSVPEEFTLQEWLGFARAAIKRAEDYERAGDDEGAFVEWRKWAQMWRLILKHPKYQESRRSLKEEYIGLQDLASRFGTAVSRTQALEDKLRARDAARDASKAQVAAPQVNGHLGESATSPTAQSSASTRSLVSAPTSPPAPSTQPILPDSPKKSRPISGGLASRMAQLQVAGLDVQPAAPKQPPSPPHAITMSPNASPMQISESASVASPPSMPTTSSSVVVPSHGGPPPIGPKPRRPLPPTPLGPSSNLAGTVGLGLEAMQPPPNRALSPLLEATGSVSRPASAPSIDQSAGGTGSMMASPPVPQINGIVVPPRATPSPNGAEATAALFPSFSDFESRFPSAPTSAPSGLSTMAAPADITSMRRSPKLGTAGRSGLQDANHRGGESESKGRTSIDIPRSSLSRPLPRTNYILPDALWQYLQPPPPDQPTLLLLDVRNRDDFDRGHIQAQFSVCLEPITLKHDVPSDRLEASLVLSPSKERDAFLSRDQFDLVVIYDQDSDNIPPHPPGAQTLETARCLYNLYIAIFERDFHRPLRRPPVILVGGYDAWTKYLKAKSENVAEASARLEAGAGRSRRGTASSSDLKRSNRKAAFAPGEDLQYGVPSVTRSVVDALTNNPYPNGDPSAHLQRTHSGFSGSPIASPPIAAMLGQSLIRQTSGTSIANSYEYSHGFSPAPRQRTTIDYPALNGIPQRPPLAAQPNGVPPRPPPLVHQVQRLSSSDYHTDAKGPDSPFTPISGPIQLRNLVNWGDGTVGLTGLKNLGNTCYMNSTLQCLSATIPLARFFKDGSYKRAINRYNPLGTRGALAEAVAQLFGVLWSEQYNFVSPVTFRDAICRFAPQFQGTDQHDSQEFLAFLLDGLHEDLNFVQQKPPPIPYTQEREAELEMLPAQIGGEREWSISLRRENSVIVAWFQGQYRSQLKCLTCGKTSTTYNNFQYLTLALPAARTLGSNRVKLEDLLSAYVQEEILDRDDAWNCPRCKAPRKATKQLTLVRLPPVLIIHLKRFQFKGPFSDKIDTPVIFPLIGVDMAPYLPPPLAPAAQAQYAKVAPDALPSALGSTQYDLYAVSEQMGTLSSGHYTAKVRSRDQWFDIGDSKVRRCDENDVRKSVKSAYILYYRRR